MFLKSLVNFFTKFNYFLFLANPFNKKDGQDEKIVLISKGLHSRVIKIAKSIRYMGGSCILVTEDNSARRGDLFDEVIICKSKIECAYMCKKHYSGFIFHVFCFWDYYLISYLIFFRVGKIIADPYDILNLFIKDSTKEKYRISCFLEKYVLQNCCAIVCRDIRSNLLKKNGYKFPQRILYMDYVDPNNECVLTQKKISSSLVYIGNLEVNRSNNVAYQYPLSKLLGEKGIDFYIYPSSPSQKIQIENNLESGELISVMDTMPYDLLHKELERYSFGLLISTKFVGFNNQHDTYNNIMAKYFFATKIFDYYQAGVIPICQKGDFISFILRRMGVGYTVDNIKDIPNLINKCRGKFITTNINETLTLKTNACRLTYFYKNLQ